MTSLSIAQNPRLVEAVGMLRELSRATTEGETFAAFMRRYPRFRPVKRFVGVMAGADGSYRVMYDLRPERLTEAEWKALGESPPRLAGPEVRGGLIGSLIATPEPKHVAGLPRGADPVLGGFEGMGSVAALPVYRLGEVAEWVVAFSADAEPPHPEMVVQAVMIANLLTSAVYQQRAIEEARALNRRLVAQFDEVARVQQSLLPSGNPRIPGLKVATSYLTSEQAGGDYYDFFTFADGRWGILIADVSGHGAAASTVMAMLHAILHAYEATTAEPDAVLEYANRRLMAAQIEGSFVTAFFAVYDPTTRVIRYSSSGHNPPRLKRGRDGRVSPLEEARTLPLGVFEPHGATSAEVRLEAMDTLVLYTDGITEAFSPSREMFGVEGLDEALAHCTGDPDCVVDSVHTALFRHTGTRDRADDQTIVALRAIPGGGAA